MNEPKRRGRPPKAKEAATPEVALVKDEVRAGMELSVIGSTRINPAQNYAQRVWDGQSVSLSRNERLERVRKALEGQGLSMEGVEL